MTLTIRFLSNCLCSGRPPRCRGVRRMFSRRVLALVSGADRGLASSMDSGRNGSACSNSQTRFLSETSPAHAQAYGAIHRWIAPYAWAWAGDVSLRKRVWEFEQADPFRPLSMEDANPRSAPETKARTLLENMRRTPLQRGGLPEHKQLLKNRIVNVMESAGVLRRLSERLALQFVYKFEGTDLGDETTWRAIGQIMREETEEVRKRVGLSDKQIIKLLPKVSAQRIERLFEDLMAANPQVARTMMNAAVDAADPITAARKYLQTYTAIVEQLQELDPTVARTLANAAFKMQQPYKAAMNYLRQFRRLLAKFKDDATFLRTLARTSAHAHDPIKTATRLVTDYDRVIAGFTSKAVEPGIARSLAGIAILGSDPLGTAYRLLQNFNDALALAEKTHPSVARSIALAACRATDPIAATRLYMANYDAIVQHINQSDPDRAHEVAGQTFRSDRPIAWAERYLAKLKSMRSRRNMRNAP